MPLPRVDMGGPAARPRGVTSHSTRKGAASLQEAKSQIINPAGCKSIAALHLLRPSSRAYNRVLPILLLYFSLLRPPWLSFARGILGGRSCRSQVRRLDCILQLHSQFQCPQQHRSHFLSRTLGPTQFGAPSALRDLQFNTASLLYDPSSPGVRCRRLHSQGARSSAC